MTDFVVFAKENGMKKMMQADEIISYKHTIQDEMYIYICIKYSYDVSLM
jgi:hypothetical protein